MFRRHKMLTSRRKQWNSGLKNWKVCCVRYSWNLDCFLKPLIWIPMQDSLNPSCLWLQMSTYNLWWWRLGVFFLEAVFFRNFESFWVVALAISGPKAPFLLNLEKLLTNKDCLCFLFGVAFIKLCKTFPKVLDWKQVYRITLFKFLEHQTFHTKNLTRSVLVFEQRCWTVTQLTASEGWVENTRVQGALATFWERDCKTINERFSVTSGQKYVSIFISYLMNFFNRINGMLEKPIRKFLPPTAMAKQLSYK